VIRTFLIAFIPLFVTIDPFGLLPIYISITQQMTRPQRQKTCFQAVFTAAIITLLFMFLGQEIFNFIRITETDFRIAGGLILLTLAILDLLIPGKPAVHEDEMVGIVPLAMPLIAGPGTLTTVLVLAGYPSIGYAYTTLALAANFLLLLAVLLLSGQIARVLGMNTLRAFSKLVMVLLAAIAVNFIRVGIMQALGK